MYIVRQFGKTVRSAGWMQRWYVACYELLGRQRVPWLPSFLARG